MSAEFLTLNRLKELLKAEGLKPNKVMGQHFLIDKNTRDKIIRLANLSEKDIVVEIGPGFGELTEGIAEKVRKVYAFEKDPNIDLFFKKRFSDKKNIEIITQDFLDVEESFFKSFPDRIKIIGNLPYYVASPILLKLIKLRNYWRFALVSLPEAVSKRITAVSGEKDFGLMAVLFSLYTNAKVCYKIGKKVFYPVPEIDSVFLAIEPMEKPSIYIPDEEIFWKTVPSIFMYKRKTIQNVLNQTFGIKKDFLKIELEKLDIEPSLRSHQLNLEQLVKIVKMIKNMI